MIMPDHVPHIEGDAGGRQAFAYCYGYLRALLEEVQGRS
jgi:mannonate dehydratase